MVITEAVHSRELQVPAPAWTPAADVDPEIRDGAWAVELTGDVQRVQRLAHSQGDGLAGGLRPEPGRRGQRREGAKRSRQR
ncbi:hypothetical protein FM21_33305 [Streptomyces mutabilis]|uniref:Uncharacterized protein n=1 Tax=Streptomyces mutabilis TaxID=67332 RepID=A0A086MRY3_9ACTN|nr:hypothetical protein FM21_33305 [Streptomyces mutabilis]